MSNLSMILQELDRFLQGTTYNKLFGLANILSNIESM